MAPKKRNSAELLQAAQAAGNAIQEQERASESRSIATLVASLPLAKISDRESNTRDLKSQHVEDLMMSIAVLGLLEPLVVDSRGRLLAGGHRKAAIELFRSQMPREYAAQFPGELIPVRVLDFDADREPDLALQVEVAENEKRRDYTPAEVRKLAEKLKLAGYADTKGRPAKGEKALRPALEVIIGKSQRTVRRYLNEDREGESGSTVRLLSDADAIGGLKTQLDKWHKAYGEWDNELIQSIDRDVVKLLKRLTAAQKKSRFQERQANASEVAMPVDTTAETIGDEENASLHRQ